MVMPYPAEYQQASRDFADFLSSVKENCMFTSSHQAYTTAQGVFLVFRNRISIPEAIRFASLLPAGLRALFVADWNPEMKRKSFASREEMIREVRSLRHAHNFSPDSAIEAVARALRSHIDEQALDSLLNDFPEGAIDYWSVDPPSSTQEV